MPIKEALLERRAISDHQRCVEYRQPTARESTASYLICTEFMRQLNEEFSIKRSVNH